jgi:nucleotide-binding universal stress UspA family protein
MSEVILAALAQPETARRLLDAARVLADEVGKAHIAALVVRIPPEATIMPTEEILSAEIRARIAAAERERAAQLRRIFDFWAAQTGEIGHQTEWIDVEGLPAKEICMRGARADLVVIDRLPRLIDRFAKDALYTALFDCHRPVLVVPPHHATSTLGKHVAIAWKDDGRAVKAVIPAMRYFAFADRISVLIGYRGDVVPDVIPAPLAERDIPAEIYPIAIGADPFGQALLAKTAEIGADVLVMGAYAHSPLREMIFGGVTRYVLHNAVLPVFIRH